MYVIMHSVNMRNAPTRPISVQIDIKQYQLVQRFEGRRGGRVRGSCIVAVSILPAEGQEGEIDRWYREESLAVLALSLIHI